MRDQDKTLFIEMTFGFWIRNPLDVDQTSGVCRKQNDFESQFTMMHLLYIKLLLTESCKGIEREENDNLCHVCSPDAFRR